MSEPLHVLVIPLWYPRSEQDVDGIFFQNQAQALQRKGIKTAILAPMFRYLRKETASILTGPYGFARCRQSGLDIYAGAACISSPLSVYRHRPHPLGARRFESLQTLHPRKRTARPDSRPLHELCRHTCPKNFRKIRHSLRFNRTQQHHHARSDPSPPMAADGKSSGARLRTSRRQPPFRTRPATQIRLRMAVPPQHTGWNIQANI